MAPVGADTKRQEGLGGDVAEIWGLVRDYAKQETVDPLRSIGRFLAYGLPGAICSWPRANAGVRRRHERRADRGVAHSGLRHPRSPSWHSIPLPRFNNCSNA